jgi:hypothetical protein
MKTSIPASVAAAVLACAACSPVAAAAALTGSAAESPAPQKNNPAMPALDDPTTLTDVDVAAADMGGAVEGLTGMYGPGLTGRRLIDGALDTVWSVPEDWAPRNMYYKPAWATYPHDIVLSFYERQPALVGAVAIVAPAAPTVKVEDASTAPRDVEVWTAMDSAPDRFTKVAGVTLEAKPGEQTITFPATEARFVKLRVLSGASERVLEIAAVRVLEATRDGYVPLFTRAPGVEHWKGSPREAAQHGLDWLQQSAIDWTTWHKCFGCHVQAQALMGQTVALGQGYRVSLPAMRALADHTRTQQTPDGTFSRNHEYTAAVFGAMGLARATDASGSTTDRELLKAVDYLLAAQAQDGSIPAENAEPPIMQGSIMMTANALEAIRWAAAHSRDPKYGKAADRALAWIAASDVSTTQDKVFKVVTLAHYGTADQKRAAWTVVENLAAEQQRDGGWKEVAATEGSNGFATGQVLYAFKQAGVSIRSPMFQRGVEYLLKTQVNAATTDNGSWKAIHTQSQRKTDFAPTMWAVIGLAGAYGTVPLGALQVVKQGDKSAGRNLEIVLDVSGSMNTKLGEGTRWQTALDVLKDVVASLPDDLNVGLRVYGHRYASKSAQTCQDTELVAPIAKLDRERILNAASQLKPRGETPLVQSVLKTIDDLKSMGGGSVILITDGEESCRGDPKAAARQIKASGVNLTLNIVGFTLTGKATEAQLSTFANSTGGHYYGAQDGQQLSRAVRMAALQRLPYDVLDDSGKLVASGETSELSRELPAGHYRVRIAALEQTLEDEFDVVPDQTTMLAVGVDGDRFVMRH